MGKEKPRGKRKKTQMGKEKSGEKTRTGGLNFVLSLQTIAKLVYSDLSSSKGLVCLVFWAWIRCTYA